MVGEQWYLVRLMEPPQFFWSGKKKPCKIAEEMSHSPLKTELIPCDGAGSEITLPE